MAVEQFKDTTRLTQWIKWILHVLVVATVASIISTALEQQFFADAQNGIFVTEEELYRAADASDKRQQIIAIIYIGLFIWSAVLIGRWIMQANKNARSLGVQNMQITPGWAIGWYFIPIANLWKPYQAMKEIWLASLSLSGGKPATLISTTVLNWWWFLWLATSAIGQYSSRSRLKADTIHEFTTANFASICSDVLMIVLCFVLLSIVSQINKAQKQAYELGVKKEVLEDVAVNDGLLAR